LTVPLTPQIHYVIDLQQFLRRRKIVTPKSFEFRLEAFNAFNHAQFYGAAAVDGEVSDPHFGEVVSASPRLVQLAAKFAF
jgi:hypothetical protein